MNCTQIEFVDRVFAEAKKEGLCVDLNRNGDRQINFDHKYLTAHDLRLLYQDIRRKSGRYSRADMEGLVAGRPCATAPFFKLVVNAGLCELETVDGRKVYRFTFVAKAAGAA